MRKGLAVELRGWGWCFATAITDAEDWGHGPKYVAPQKAKADLVIEVLPSEIAPPKDETAPLEYLRVRCACRRVNSSPPSISVMDLILMKLIPRELITPLFSGEINSMRNCFQVKIHT